MVAAPPFRREEGCSLFGEASGTYFPPDLFQGLCCLCLKHRQPALCPPIFMRPFMHARILARLGPPEAPPACQPAFARVARMPPCIGESLRARHYRIRLRAALRSSIWSLHCPCACIWPRVWLPCEPAQSHSNPLANVRAASLPSSGSGGLRARGRASAFARLVAFVQSSVAFAHVEHNPRRSFASPGLFSHQPGVGP